MMPGIVFLGTQKMDEVVDFYTSRFGMEIWLRQKDCTILRFDNMTIGFCQRRRADTEGIITFWYDTKEEVDAMYVRLEELAEDAPSENPRYRIYHFFLRDPEGRCVEVQKFLDF